MCGAYQRTGRLRQRHLFIAACRLSQPLRPPTAGLTASSLRDLWPSARVPHTIYGHLTSPCRFILLFRLPPINSTPPARPYTVPGCIRFRSCASSAGRAGGKLSTRIHGRFFVFTPPSPGRFSRVLGLTPCALLAAQRPATPPRKNVVARSAATWQSAAPEPGHHVKGKDARF